MYFRLSVCLSVHLSVCLSVCLSVYLSLNTILEKKPGKRSKEPRVSRIV